MKFKKYQLSATEALTKAGRTDRVCREIRKMDDFYLLYQKENQDIYFFKK